MDRNPILTERLTDIYEALCFWRASAPSFRLVDLLKGRKMGVRTVGLHTAGYRFFFAELLPLVPYAKQEYERGGILKTDYDFRVHESGSRGSVVSTERNQGRDVDAAE